MNIMIDIVIYYILLSIRFQTITDWIPLWMGQPQGFLPGIPGRSLTRIGWGKVMPAEGI